MRPHGSELPASCLSIYAEECRAQRRTGTVSARASRQDAVLSNLKIARLGTLAPWPASSFRSGLIAEQCKQRCSRQGGHAVPGPPYFLAALQQRQGVACSTSRPVNPGAGGLRTTRAALQLGATLAARASGAAARAVEAAAAGGGQRKAAADTAEVRASRGGATGPGAGGIPALHCLLRLLHCLLRLHCSLSGPLSLFSARVVLQRARRQPAAAGAVAASGGGGAGAALGRLGLGAAHLQLRVLRRLLGMVHGSVPQGGS